MHGVCQGETKFQMLLGMGRRSIKPLWRYLNEGLVAPAHSSCETIATSVATYYPATRAPIIYYFMLTIWATNILKKLTNLSSLSRSVNSLLMSAYSTQVPERRRDSSFSTMPRYRRSFLKTFVIGIISRKGCNLTRVL